MRKNNNSGFTLIEVLAVVVIVGILMVVALPTYSAVYNNIKRTTYLNKLKALNIAATEYGDNAEIKDKIKNLSRVDNGNWCLEVNVSDLIRVGYISSDTDNSEELIDLYTGAAIGHNAKPDPGIEDSSVALCYCYEDLDIKSFLINDLESGLSYHEGEYVRNYETSGGKTFPVFYLVKTSFKYDTVYKAIKNAVDSGETSVTVDGEKIDFDSTFSDNPGPTEKANRIKGLIITKYTEKASCNRHP